MNAHVRVSIELAVLIWRKACQLEGGIERMFLMCGTLYNSSVSDYKIAGITQRYGIEPTITSTEGYHTKSSTACRTEE